ncbi:hypothetical protein Plhal304r1_c005g0019281 [Plasmopara halstedii]
MRSEWWWDMDFTIIDVTDAQSSRNSRYSARSSFVRCLVETNKCKSQYGPYFVGVEYHRVRNVNCTRTYYTLCNCYGSMVLAMMRITGRALGHVAVSLMSCNACRSII